MHPGQPGYVDQSVSSREGPGRSADCAGPHRSVEPRQLLTSAEVAPASRCSINK
jgi:hypothetical protein